MPYFIGFETTSEWVDLIILLIGISLIIQSDDNSGVQNFFLINNLSSFRPTSCWHTSLSVQSSILEIMKFFLPSGRMCEYVAKCVHVLETIMLSSCNKNEYLCRLTYLKCLTLNNSIPGFRQKTTFNYHKQRINCVNFENILFSYFFKCFTTDRPRTLWQLYFAIFLLLWLDCTSK